MDGDNTNVSLAQIAEHLGVDKSTVSRALKDQGRISPEMRERIKRTAREMGYISSAMMSRAMRAARMGDVPSFRETIACIVPLGKHIDPGQYSPTYKKELYKSRLYAGLVDRAKETGVRLDFFFPPEDLTSRPEQILRNRGIERIIFLGKAARLTPEKMPDVESTNPYVRLWNLFPCVFTDVSDARLVSGVCVRPDYFDAGRRCFAEAWVKGYRHFYITQLTDHADTEGRFLAGMRLATGLDIPFLSWDYEILQLEDHCDTKAWLDRADSNMCLVGVFDDDLRELAIRRLKKNNPPAFIVLNHNADPKATPLTGLDQRDYHRGRQILNLALSQESHESGKYSQVSIVHLIETRWIEGHSLPIIKNDHLNLLPDKPYKDAQSEAFEILNLRAMHNADTPRTHNVFRGSAASSPPPGKWEFHGIPFEVEGAGLIPNFSIFSWDKHQPEASPAGYKDYRLPIGRKARSIYFLHACGFVQSLQDIVLITVEYADGSTYRFPIRAYGPVSEAQGELKNVPPDVNIQDWYPLCDYINTRNARAVFLLNTCNSNGRAGYIYTLRWKNPRPEKTIESLRMEAQSEELNKNANAVWMIYAMTLGK